MGLWELVPRNISGNMPSRTWVKALFQDRIKLCSSLTLAGTFIEMLLSSVVGKYKSFIFSDSFLLGVGQLPPKNPTTSATEMVSFCQNLRFQRQAF